MTKVDALNKQTSQNVKIEIEPYEVDYEKFI